MSKNDTRTIWSRSHRVLAWWDVAFNIDTFHRKKPSSRPLKDREDALGHHVESRLRYGQMPPNIWKFETYHYFDTHDPALAAHFVLMHLSPFSEWLGMSWQDYTVAATRSDDLDDVTICTRYWHSPVQCADCVIEFAIRIICGNKQHLMRFHWPHFQASRWPERFDFIDVDARTHAGKPSIIRVCQTLR